MKRIIESRPEGLHAMALTAEDNVKKEVSPISQEELLAFLLNARSYPHRPKHVCLKQTHSSYVLLAAPYAYKIKKPVNFGFLRLSPSSGSIKAIYGANGRCFG